MKVSVQLVDWCTTGACLLLLHMVPKERKQTVIKEASIILISEIRGKTKFLIIRACYR